MCLRRRIRDRNHEDDDVDELACSDTDFVVFDFDGYPCWHYLIMHRGNYDDQDFSSVIMWCVCGQRSETFFLLYWGIAIPQCVAPVNLLCVDGYPPVQNYHDVRRWFCDRNHGNDDDDEPGMQ